MANGPLFLVTKKLEYRSLSQPEPLKDFKGLQLKMGSEVEIERKWLMRPNLPLGSIRILSKVHIVQIYNGPFRIRRTQSNGQQSIYELTCKFGKGLSRQEETIEVSKLLMAHFRNCATDPKTYQVPKITKDVHKTPTGEELHIFKRLLDGLILMEKEFNSEEEAIRYKPILKDYIIKEVTHNPRYLNMNLAVTQEIPMEI